MKGNWQQTSIDDIKNILLEHKEYYLGFSRLRNIKTNEIISPQLDMIFMDWLSALSIAQINSDEWVYEIDFSLGAEENTF